MKPSEKFQQFLIRFEPELMKLRFDTGKNLDLMNSGFLAKQFDLAESIKGLLSVESITGIPILVRSIYEAFIDLKLSNINEDHIRQLILKEAARSKKAAENAKKAPPDSLLKALYPTEESVSAEVEYYEDLRRRGEELGIKGSPTLEKRFSELAMSDHYDSIYAYLSKFVHTSPLMIATKYLNIENNAVTSIRLFPIYKESEIHALLVLTMRLLFESLGICLDRANIDRNTILPALDAIITAS